MAKPVAGGARPRNRIEQNKGGRPIGSMNKLAKASRERALETGALPHELLLQWSRGEPMSRKVPPSRESGKDPNNIDNWVWEYVPQEEDSMRDCAKAAAPYYAPKLAVQEVIGGVSDADLDEFIARAAAEAGLSVGTGGESQEDPRQADAEDQG